MLWLNDAVIETARQGIPIISSILGAGIGAERAARKGKSSWVKVAGYAGLGWAVGYTARSILLRVLEGTGPALPSATEQLPDALPEPPITTASMQGLYVPPSRPAGEVDATPAPPPEPRRTPDIKASGEVISIRGSMDNGAMGSAYGA